MSIPDDVLDLWDDLDGAIDRVVTALPGQMTAASDNLEEKRKAFRSLIMKAALRRQPEGT